MSDPRLTVIRDALDMAYDPPSEAHSAFDELVAELESLRRVRDATIEHALACPQLLAVIAAGWHNG